MDAMKREIISWKVADLHESPHQQALFGNLSDRELAELIEDLRLHGQRTPLEIRRSGEILDGHQRLRAAKELNWEELDVAVRDDLVDANGETIECEMISCNLHRRQLDILQIANLYKRLRQIDRGCDADVFGGAIRQDVRDLLAARLGNRSGRTLDRYLRLLRTPKEVQDAVRKQELSMSAASKVAKLIEEDKAEIAAAIRAGQSAKAAIDAFFEARRARPADPALSEWLEDVTSAVVALPAVPERQAASEVFKTVQAEVDVLQELIAAVVDAELPNDRKVETLKEAAACLESLIDTPAEYI